MKSFLKTFASSLLYLTVAAACVVQWNGDAIRHRIDWFVVCYFALRFASSLHSIVSSLGAYQSPPVRDEWWALNSDPAGPRWVMFLMFLDLAVFLDYGHWRLTPWLARSPLQTMGLVLYGAVAIWQIWTDSYLARFFAGNDLMQSPMRDGPYRYIRHPRYTAAIAGKIAMALIFASVFGWLMAIAWALLLLNKIEVEEKHLRKLFGARFESYARATAKVIPWVF